MYARRSTVCPRGILPVILGIMISSNATSFSMICALKIGSQNLSRVRGHKQERGPDHLRGAVAHSTNDQDQARHVRCQDGYDRNPLLRIFPLLIDMTLSRGLPVLLRR